MELIKYIWDFRGDAALKTAEHHAIHLNEFIKTKSLSQSSANFQQLSHLHSIAFIISTREHLLLIRDSLKPHRAEKV